MLGRRTAISSTAPSSTVSADTTSLAALLARTVNCSVPIAAAPAAHSSSSAATMAPLCAAAVYFSSREARPRSRRAANHPRTLAGRACRAAR